MSVAWSETLTLRGVAGEVIDSLATFLELQDARELALKDIDSMLYYHCTK